MSEYGLQPQDRIIRSKRKTLSAEVRMDGKVIVRAPLKLSEKSIYRFLNDKKDWIARHREQAIRKIQLKPVRQYVEGEKFLYLGKWYDLMIVPDLREAVEFKNGFYMSENARENARLAMYRWYHRQAHELMPDQVEILAVRMKLEYKGFRLSRANTRWGVCGPDGTIRLSWRLMMAPMFVIQGVIIHELVHLLHRNHSKHFWNTVYRYDPSYDQVNQWLKDHEIYMMI